MYQWNAGDYARNSQGQQVWARELLAVLDPQPDDDILDIGCGDGRITAAIAASVSSGSVVGIDFSQDMIEYARRSFPQAAHPRLAFLQCDARALSFDAQFSAVFSSATLHWIREQIPVVDGIARALRPGGRLVAQFGGHGNGADVVRAFLSVGSRPRWRQAYRSFEPAYGFFTPQQYAGWLQAAGFEVSEARLIPKDMAHVDREAFTGWLRTAWHPYTSPVADNERAALIDEVADEYCRRHAPDAQDGIHVAMVRLQVQARKR